MLFLQTGPSQSFQKGKTMSKHVVISLPGESFEECFYYKAWDWMKLLVHKWGCWTKDKTYFPFPAPAFAVPRSQALATHMLISLTVDFCEV